MSKRGVTGRPGRRMKGLSAEGNVRHALPGPAAEQGRDCHIVCGVLRCVAIYDYIAFCAGFQAGFFVICAKMCTPVYNAA